MEFKVSNEELKRTKMRRVGFFYTHVYYWFIWTREVLRNASKNYRIIYLKDDREIYSSTLKY